MRLNILSRIVGGEFSINALCLVLQGLLAFSLWVGFFFSPLIYSGWKAIRICFHCVSMYVCACMSVHIIGYLCVSVRHVCKRGVSVFVGETRGQPNIIPNIPSIFF